MAILSHPWSILIIINLPVVMLVTQLSIAKKSCSIWSTAGTVVQRGSSLDVYCKFVCKCKKPNYSTNPLPVSINSTHVHFKMANITNDMTFSCQCEACKRDRCGLDVYTGYPPDTPDNIKCTHSATNGEMGVVVCTWKRGRETYFQNFSELRVTTRSGNDTNGPMFYKGFNNGSDRLSANFTVSRRVQDISVSVYTNNTLGNASSTSLNFTLSAIVMPSPPVLSQAQCSSKHCVIHLAPAQRTQHLQIQYRTEQMAWMTSTHHNWQPGPVDVPSIFSLEPYRQYDFRARTKFSTGLWSRWSNAISNWTQEEALAEALDVWFSRPTDKSPQITVYWKHLKESNTRGKIIACKAEVQDLKTGNYSNWNISASVNLAVPLCAKYKITVWACNSKGFSPPAHIFIFPTTAHPPEDVCVLFSNFNVSISWRKPKTTLMHTGYLVEWYPVGQQVEELQWLRYGPNETNAVITEMKPYKCYQGAVYVFYDDNSYGKADFVNVALLESVPTGSPSIQPEQLIAYKTVTVTWTEIPWAQQRGCIRSYSIYTKDDKNISWNYHGIFPTEMTHNITDLPPAQYRMWMTAWTSQGEGPPGESVLVLIQATQKERSSGTVIGVTFMIVFLILLFILRLWQISTIQRFYRFLHIRMLDVVPDPANSKWARECAKEKGKMNLELLISDSSLSEEEPVTMEIQELQEEESSSPSTPDTASPTLLLLPSSSPVTNTAENLYRPISYIKSFSHESESSDHTHHSQHTTATVGYLSTQVPEDEIEEEEDEEDCMGVLDFFPSHNGIMDPPVCWGKLTLDAVRIDCTELLGERLVLS